MAVVPFSIVLLVVHLLGRSVSLPVAKEAQQQPAPYPNPLDAFWLQSGSQPPLPREDNQIVEGDIIINKGGVDKNGALAHDRWPNARIPYYMDPAFTQEEKSLILSTMTEFFQKTAVHFVPWVQGDADYIYIRRGGPNTGCNSYVGNMKNGQYVNLEVSNVGNCIHFKTVLHELTHAAGFWHEQSRPDRDTYVEIDLNNVPRDFWHAFDLKPATTTFNLPYDIYSLMHYGRYDFAIDRNKWTIRPRGKDQNVQMLGVQSSYSGFTDLDLQKLKAMYPHCGRGFTEKLQKGSFWQFAPASNFGDVNYTTMRSIKVEQGCSMRVCGAKNFGGSCQTFSAGVWDLPANIDNNVRALSCTC